MATFEALKLVWRNENGSWMIGWIPVVVNCFLFISTISIRLTALLFRPFLALHNAEKYQLCLNDLEGQIWYCKTSIFSIALISIFFDDDSAESHEWHGWKNKPCWSKHLSKPNVISENPNAFPLLCLEVFARADINFWCPSNNKSIMHMHCTHIFTSRQ